MRLMVPDRKNSHYIMTRKPKQAHNRNIIQKVQNLGFLIIKRDKMACQEHISFNGSFYPSSKGLFTPVVSVTY